MILVEVLRRHSNNYGAVQRVGQLIRHLKQQTTNGQRHARPLPRPEYQPRKLAQRLSNETTTAILAAYRAGATTREVGERFGLAHSSINKLLKQHGVTARRRSPSRHELRQAIELYEAGLSTRIIGERLGFGASTILRALTKAKVQLRTERGTNRDSEQPEQPSCLFAPTSFRETIKSNERPHLGPKTESTRLSGSRGHRAGIEAQSRQGNRLGRAGNARHGGSVHRSFHLPWSPHLDA